MGDNSIVVLLIELSATREVGGWFDGWMCLATVRLLGKIG